MATEVASLTALLSLDDSGFQRGMQEAQNSMNNFGDRAGGLRSAISGISDGLQSAGASISSFGANLTLATAPIAAIGAVGLNAFGDFESAINEIGARTGVVGQDLKDIADYALDMGAATVFSGKQAADAFLDLLTSGQSVEEAYATLPQVMNLAAAGGLELGQSADTITDIMAQFGLTVADTVGELEAAEYVANQLTAASQVSSASVDMLAQSFANVGGIASGMGLDVEETSAALAILAENGIKGAEAGTNLKSMLLNMTSTTTKAGDALEDLEVSLYDVDGNMRPLTDIIEDLRQRMSGMADNELNAYIQELAGSYGQAGLRALLFGGDLATTKRAMDDAALASDVAEQMMGSWNNTVDSLMGSLESLAISVLWPLVDSTLKPLVNQLINVVNGIKAWTDENPELTLQIGQLLAAAVAAGPLLFGFGKAVSFVGVLVGALASPIALIVAGIGLLAAAFITDFGGIRTALEPIFATLQEGLGRLWMSLGWFVEDIQQVGIGDAIKRAFGMDESDMDTFNDSWIEGVLVNFGMARDDAVGITQEVGGAVTGLINKLQGLWPVILEGWNDAKSALSMFTEFFVVPALQQGVDNLKTGIKALWDLIVQGASMIEPYLDALFQWFTASAVPAIIGFITGQLLPALSRIWSDIQAGWQAIQPDLERLANWFINSFIPTAIDIIVWALQGLWTVIKDAWEIISPTLAHIYDWFVTFAIPAIYTIITDVLVPALQGLWDLLAGAWEVVRPGLEAVYNFIMNVMLPAIVYAIINYVTPAINGFLNLLVNAWNYIRPGVEALASGIMSVLQPVVDFIAGLMQGFNDLVNAASGWVGGLNPFGGGRADGGPVTGGTPYIVGERGPELFVPNSSGAIIPNEAMGARVRIDSVVINAPTGDGSDIARAFEVELNELMRARG